jgi:cell division protease FtsH
MMAGRAAEQLILGTITTGASDDIGKATDLARRMVVEFGMSDKVGALSLRRPEEEVFLGRDITREPRYSNKTAELIDEEVKRIVDEAKQHAHKILAENQEKLKALAEALIEKEILDASEVDAIMRGETLPPPKTAGGASAETPQPQQEPGKNPSNA